ncbi:MAG: methyltransferase [Oscillospiraceae bacterium]|jgi:23S rRNA G2445 N2-methylase RlmL|nr:methyltransferase [Oscillospiraceae bacterium]
MRYFAAFTSGLQDVVRDILVKKVRNVRIVSVLDGAVVFEGLDGIRLPCFNNLFEVIYTWENNRKSIDLLMMDMIKYGKGISCNDKSRSFRVVTSVENRLVSVNNSVKARMEQRIRQDTRLSLERSGADEEYWFLIRSENMAFFMRRITFHKPYDKIMRKGELHPDICYCMAWLAGIKAGDIVLDPFCGYGAIPVCVKNNFVYGHMYASDKDVGKINYVKGRFKRADKVDVFGCDVFLIQEKVERSSVDVIITDPPWGAFDREYSDYYEFYERVFRQFLMILRGNAVIVLLTARKQEVERICENYRAVLGIRESYNILVSGKKAAVYVIRVEEQTTLATRVQRNAGPSWPG